MPEKLNNLMKYIEKAVRAYNRYRGLEVQAKIIGYSENTLIIDFKGTYCQTCGLCDYFEDLVYDLKDLIDLEIKIENAEPIGRDTYRVKYVTTKVKEEKEV